MTNVTPNLAMRTRHPQAVLAEAQALITNNNSWPDRRLMHWDVQQGHEHEWVVPVIRLLQHTPQTQVLDVGCGYGTLAVAARLCGHSVTAVDLFVEPPDLRGIDWRKQDVQEPGALFAGSFYGVVVMTEVLEHLTVNPTVLLGEIADGMTPGGWFVGACPDPDYWPEEAPRTPDALPEWTDDHKHVDAHVAFYPQATTIDLMQSAGLDVLAIYNIGATRARYCWMARKG